MSQPNGCKVSHPCLTAELAASAILGLALRLPTLKSGIMMYSETNVRVPDCTGKRHALSLIVMKTEYMVYCK